MHVCNFLYPEEGSIAQTTVKTLKITASVLQLSNLHNTIWYVNPTLQMIILCSVLGHVILTFFTLSLYLWWASFRLKNSIIYQVSCWTMLFLLFSLSLMVFFMSVSPSKEIYHFTRFPVSCFRFFVFESTLKFTTDLENCNIS